MSERFKLENIKQVSLVRTRDIIEFCGIEADTGIVHWLSEDEYKEIHGLVKALGSGPYRNRKDEEHAALAQAAEESSARAKQAEEALQSTNQDAAIAAEASNNRIAELEDLVHKAHGAIVEMNLRAQLAQVAKVDA